MTSYELRDKRGSVGYEARPYDGSLWPHENPNKWEECAVSTRYGTVYVKPAGGNWQVGYYSDFSVPQTGWMADLAERQKEFFRGADIETLLHHLSYCHHHDVWWTDEVEHRAGCELMKRDRMVVFEAMCEALTHTTQRYVLNSFSRFLSNRRGPVKELTASMIENLLAMIEKDMREEVNLAAAYLNDTVLRLLQIGGPVSMKEEIIDVVKTYKERQFTPTSKNYFIAGLCDEVIAVWNNL